MLDSPWAFSPREEKLKYFTKNKHMLFSPMKKCPTCTNVILQLVLMAVLCLVAGYKAVVRSRSGFRVVRFIWIIGIGVMVNIKQESSKC